MAEFSMDKMAHSVAERAMEELKDSGVFDADTISRKHLLSEIDKLIQSPWFNNGKDFYDDTTTHYGYVERKEAVEIVRDLCVKAEPSITPKQRLCKDCKFFEYDHMENVEGIPLIVAHEICNKWSDGCKTKEDGYCFLFEPKEGENK